MENERPSLYLYFSSYHISTNKLSYEDELRIVAGIGALGYEESTADTSVFFDLVTPFKYPTTLVAPDCAIRLCTTAGTMQGCSISPAQTPRLRRAPASIPPSHHPNCLLHNASPNLGAMQLSRPHRNRNRDISPAHGPTSPAYT
jgi:hypothetical protein